MKELIKESDEVYYCIDQIPKISKKEILTLLSKAKKNSSNKARICMHKNLNEKIHDMFIVHLKDCYVRPHKHLNKSESMFVIEGEADAIIFDDTGKILQKIELGNYASGKDFCYRINQNIFHMLLIKSEFFIFHENTEGPFNNTETIFAKWAPIKSDKFILESVSSYQYKKS